MTPGPDETGGDVDVDVATNQIEGGDVSLPEKGTKEKPYDPEPNRDKVRGYLAGGLVILLVAVIVAAWLTFIYTNETEADIKDLLGVILPPVVALVGSALGFYFGGKPTGK